MIHAIRRMIESRPDGVVIYECRRCGTTLDYETDTCPYCGPTDVVRFEIR